MTTAVTHTLACEEGRSAVTDPLPSGRVIEFIRSSANYQIHELSGSRVRASLSLNEAHHQPFGRVHGGIYAIVVEGVASAGACAAVADRGMYAVGTSNTTDFLRPVAVDRVEVLAEPIFQGRTPAAVAGFDHPPQRRQARGARAVTPAEPAIARRFPDIGSFTELRIPMARGS